MENSNPKPRSLENIEEKMQNMEPGSIRRHILECSKNFKTSWIELGRSLYAVSKDKLYKEWGYGSFDIYVAREIGIRKQTAVKLLRSYFFLEKEEPHYLKSDYIENSDAKMIPSYESVDVLRKAKNKKSIDENDYNALKREVFEKGKDSVEVKKDLTSLIRQREELDPEEARLKKKNATLRRFLGTLKAIKMEIEISKLLPASVIKEANMLIDKLEAEID